MPKFSWFLEVLDDEVRPDVVEVLGENLLAEEASEHCLGVLNGMPPNKHIEPVSKLLILHHVSDDMTLVVEQIPVRSGADEALEPLVLVLGVDQGLVSEGANLVGQVDLL